MKKIFRVRIKFEELEPPRGAQIEDEKVIIAYEFRPLIVFARDPGSAIRKAANMVSANT